ncbi:ankyrin repeat and KH domain-containing protein mask-like [Lineus longissimus]|uniref:ankyrin repeat and KH domain-containing protein mask-like n=1 Tax=Lineus longissimus TaxID=88925 RepID=UPI00315DA168
MAIQGTKTSIDCRALIKACRKGNVEEVEELLEAGVDVDSLDSKTKETALIIAVKNRNTEVVKTLLQADADVNLDTKRGTALLTAVTLGFTEMCKLLLEGGALLTKRWFLHYSCKYRFFRVAELLLDFGADGDFCVENTTPLILAATYGDFETVRLLLERCDVNFERQGERALIAACAGRSFIETSHKAILNILLRHNLDVNYLNEKGRSAICEATQRRESNDVVKLLLDHGALLQIDSLVDICDPEHFEDDLSSALAGAVKHGRDSTVRLLLDLGADVNEIWRKDVNTTTSIFEPGETDISMLMIASLNCHFNVVKELLDRGADVNRRNSVGNTALHVVIHADFRPLASIFRVPRCRYADQSPLIPRSGIIAELLRNGSSVAAKNQVGQTPLDICMQLIIDPNSLRPEVRDGNQVALVYLLKAHSKPANIQRVLTKLWDTAKTTKRSDFDILEETIRVVVAAGVKPPLMSRYEYQSEDIRQPEAFALQEWLKDRSENPVPLRDQCRTRVRASLRLPLLDVQTESWGLPVPLRRFLIMDDLELSVRGHPDLQLLKISS